MKTAVIVQARMSSTRLPGKVMMMLEGKTFLEHCLDRCARIPGIGEVICATSVEPDCDAIADLCHRRGWRCYRGSLNDVLGRYLGAAEAADVTGVMRVTSDCPIIDPEVAGWIAERFKAGGVDLVTNNLPPSWPHGLDVEMITIDALREAAAETQSAFDREHVSPFIRTRPTRYRIQNIPCPLEGRGRYRVTLDTEADRQFFVALAQSLPTPIADTGWREIVAHLDRHPELVAINAPPDASVGRR